MSCNSAAIGNTDGIADHINPALSCRLPWLRRAVMQLAALDSRRRQRQRLLQLDDRLLADIGISREQAQREAMKPFWR